MSDGGSSSDRPSESLVPPDWQALAPLVDAVLDAPRDQRAAALAKAGGGDPARRAAIERLVDECERDLPLLNRPAGERFGQLLSDASEAPPPDMLGGRYRIGRELGRGGMARVYLAHDSKHSRDVAVKVIRPDLAASLGRERFLREIGIATRLRHPNIVPLYDSGDADGVLYFVMPYEDGPSLRGRLAAGGPLSATECVSVLRDIARALAYAHDRGIVHRDVKPDNVMLSGGAAVVTDFGIAKAVSEAQGGTSPLTITQVGAGLGTPAYMAPEQAVGDPSTDHRADIYAFGCLAYELFAGKPPFHGMPIHQVIAAHVSAAPVPVTQLSTAVPPRVAQLIAKCLEKLPDARPQSAHELLAELEASPTESFETVARPSRKRTTLVALSVVAAALIAVVGYLASRSAPPRELTIAVLPLMSVGGDSVQRDLAGGLSDEVAVALNRVPGVRVMSRGGVSNYRGQRDINPQKIGHDLGVAFLVTGSLREVGGRLRVLASLVDVHDGAVRWSDQFDRDPADLGMVRDEIAKAVGDTLQRALGPRAGAVAAPRTVARATNPEAYRLYVLAQRALARRGQSMEESIKLFRLATEIDTSYADAYSGLSFALAINMYFAPTPDGPAEVVRVAEHALRLDSTSVDAHIARGFVHERANEWQRAEEEFRTAVRLGSHDVEAHLQYGRHLISRGRVADALTQLLLAHNDDRASAVLSSWLSYAYYVDGRMDSALVESDRAMQSDTTNGTTLSHGALIRLKMGRRNEAHSRIVKISKPGPVALYVRAALGDTADPAWRIGKVGSPLVRAPWNEADRMYATLGAGDTTQALDALEHAMHANETWILASLRDPMFDPIRASPRFRRVIEQLGLPPSEVDAIVRRQSTIEARVPARAIR